MASRTWLAQAQPPVSATTCFFPPKSPPPRLQSRSKLYSWKALRAVARTNLQAFAAVRRCFCLVCFLLQPALAGAARVVDDQRLLLLHSLLPAVPGYPGGLSSVKARPAATRQFTSFH
jgi:hypothetical protein